MREGSGGIPIVEEMHPPGLRWAAQPPHDERDYLCRSCGRTERGSFVPAGWYTVHRALGGNVKQRRLGLYCTLTCLMTAHRQLQAGAAEHAESLGLPADDRSVLDSLFEEAHRYVVGDGLTFRDAGNLIGVPTGVLRDWFRSAGIAAIDTATDGMTGKSASESIADFLAAKRHSPSVSVIEELKAAQHLTALHWTYSSTGPAHRPTFTCTVSATTAAGESAVLRAQGSKKPAAKSAAAEQLIIRLLAGAPPQSGEAQKPERPGQQVE